MFEGLFKKDGAPGIEVGEVPVTEVEMKGGVDGDQYPEMDGEQRKAA